MTRTFFLLCALLIFTRIAAQTAREEIYANPRLSASNYYAYPTPLQRPSAPPKGYSPFYISTYARHGSRYFLNGDIYTDALSVLQEAEKLGKLRPQGREVLRMVDSITHLSSQRLGELTPLGAKQHRDIALRMYQNYPSIFADTAHVVARSSTIIRCILSMAAECLQLQALNAQLRIDLDASLSDKQYLVDGDERLFALRGSPPYLAFKDALDQQYVHPERLMSILFNDTGYVANFVHQKMLMERLFDIARNMQSHDLDLPLLPIFTKEELYDLWQRDNLNWYLKSGPSPLTQSRMPYMVADLLGNILDMADSAIEHRGISANLRFGHESMLLPLAALMELNDIGKAARNVDSIMDFWRNYKIFPMASNIQLVFFKRHNTAEILVAVLLNEQEATLPLHTDTPPFYQWDEVAAYYRQKLAKAALSPMVH